MNLLNCFAVAFSLSLISYQVSANGNEKDGVGGDICDVVASYGVEAAKEKFHNPLMSQDEAFGVVMYGAEKESGLSSGELDLFGRVISDAYSFVYKHDVSIEDARLKVRDYCVKKTYIAERMLKERELLCKKKAELIGQIYNIKKSGIKESEVRLMYNSDTDPNLFNIMSEITSLVYGYPDGDSYSETVSRSHKECLVDF